MTTREHALTFLRGLKLGNYGATMTIYQDVVDHVLGALDETEAALQREIERGYRRCGEGSRRNEEGTVLHGAGSDYGPLEGCDIKYHLASQLYRCGACDVAFCKPCLLAHFARSGDGSAKIGVMVRKEHIHDMKVADDLVRTQKAEIGALRGAIEAFMGGHTHDEIMLAASEPCDGSAFSLGAHALTMRPTSALHRDDPKMRRCPACKRLTRDTTAGCDHCDLEDK